MGRERKNKQTLAAVGQDRYNRKRNFLAEQCKSCSFRVQLCRIRKLQNTALSHRNLGNNSKTNAQSLEIHLPIFIPLFPFFYRNQEHYQSRSTRQRPLSNLAAGMPQHFVSMHLVHLAAF